MDDTPTKLFLETSLPTSASPYPSPSSAFYPPPIPASHEFANKLSSSLVGNKRYRGSGASQTGRTSPVNGAAAGTGAMAGTAAANWNNGAGLSPSSATSSRRGSASAPSPLSTARPLVAQWDVTAEPKKPRTSSKSPRSSASLPPSNSTLKEEPMKDTKPVLAAAFVAEDSMSSHDKRLPNSLLDVPGGAHPLSSHTGPVPSSSPTLPPTSTTDPKTPPKPVTILPTSTATSNATQATPTPSSHPANSHTSSANGIPQQQQQQPPPPPPQPSSTAGSTPSSKRASQILESLTPTRAAPPSPGPSRRGSLIRRGSSTRRWSRGSGPHSSSGGSGGELTVSGIMGELTPIGASAWLGGIERAAGAGGGTSSTVSEDGSWEEEHAHYHHRSSSRASSSLSTWNPLASTKKGEVSSVSNPVAEPPIASASTMTTIPSAETTDVENVAAESCENAPGDVKVETPTEVAEPATPADAGTETEGGGCYEVGDSPSKPILVADFAFPPEDARHSKRPFYLLTRSERAALSPEERRAYGVRRREGDEEEWEEEAEEEELEEEEGGWGWTGVAALPPRRRRRGGGRGDPEEEGDGEEEEVEDEEMTPRRFAHGYPYSEEGFSTPTAAGGSYTYSYSASISQGEGEVGEEQEGGGGGGGGGIDPDLPLPPGIYRALYSFEAEGTAEMSLSEGQLVRVIGRGGGVGWAVVERGWEPDEKTLGGGEGGSGGDGMEEALDASNDSNAVGEESTGALGMAGQALVPEGYLEIWMLDGEEWGSGDRDFDESS